MKLLVNENPDLNNITFIEILIHIDKHVLFTKNLQFCKFFNAYIVIYIYIYITFFISVLSLNAVCQ